MRRGVAFAFMALRANSWICCPQLPPHHPKTGRTAHVLATQGGTRRVSSLHKPRKNQDVGKFRH